MYLRSLCSVTRSTKTVSVKLEIFPAKRHKTQEGHRVSLKVHILPKARKKKKKGRKLFPENSKGEITVPVLLHIGKEQNSTNPYCRTEGFNIHVPLDSGERSIYCKVHACFRKSTMFSRHYISYTSGKVEWKCLNFPWHSDIKNCLLHTAHLVQVPKFLHLVGKE